jgi:hypothetical protein
MIEVYQNLFVGSELDEQRVRGQSGWFFVHACKEPYHREALGYRTQGAPKTHPEYLIARRDDRLILNLVDVADVNFIAPEIVDTAIEAIHSNVAARKVLVHCNQGQSRSPTIAFLYLAKHSDQFRGADFETASRDFARIYPPFAPARGMAEYARLNWLRYSAR